MLKNVKVSADNYDSAWQAMLEQYDNKCVMLTAHMSNVIACPVIPKQSVQEVKRILGVIRESKQAIDNLAIPADKIGELWLIHHAAHKLDPSTRLEWERKVEQNAEYPTYAELISFLESTARILGAAQDKTATNANASTSVKSSTTTAGKKGKKVSAHAVSAQSNKQQQQSRSCPLCQGNHTLYVCKKLQAMTQPQRLEFCKREKLCLNCLQSSHFAKDCPSSKSCLVCQGRRHTKLHSESHATSNSRSESQEDATPEGTSTKPSPPEASSAHVSTQVELLAVSAKKGVLLATAQVILVDPDGSKLKVRALIDPGAERSFVAERVLTQLSPPLKKISISVTGVGAVVTSKVTREACLVLAAEHNPTFTHEFQGLVLPDLTRLLPEVELQNKEWQHLKGLTLADPSYCKPSKVDCIIGADTYPSILLNGLVKGPPGTPRTQNTIFGWVLTGEVTSATACCHATVEAFHIQTVPALTKLVEKFWEIEDLPQAKPLTPDEQYCEDYFERTTYRNSQGRFVVRLPFAKTPTFIGSRDIAVARLLRSEGRQRKNPLLLELYRDFMLDYQTQGHMEIVPSQEFSHSHYYFPHHGIFRQDNPKKIRVVFNASQRAVNGLSLNEVLLPGPRLQRFITVIITIWRFYKIAFVTDIVQMFRQILIHADDADWQRLVWRPAPDQPIQDYRAVTVTYGTTPAPYLAMKTLKKLAEDGKESHPAAASMLLVQTYMNDIFGGGDHVQQAIERRDQLIRLLSTACMQLGKWSANDPMLLQGLTTVPNTEVPVKVDEVVSTTGLKWHTGRYSHQENHSSGDSQTI